MVKIGKLATNFHYGLFNVNSLIDGFWAQLSLKYITPPVVYTHKYYFTFIVIISMNMIG